MATPVEFFKQVRTEVKKVTWPTRAETMQSAIAVFFMVLVASLFLFGADQLISLVIRKILGLG
ncbi:MAG: preprotein translocase subunit SecE [Micavibrio aeruginosavorus]|uniref:Protein translocase subunit SecE n=1 Tax=Micavibrio aeruginosavorus TaxID=349221 RepID=A0A2W5FFY2_9BACT|nr:MAG: preprotein translocase subunit SecE [Micavibrio aeruginosavorus]